MRTLENYKNGENVFVHATDKRETSYIGIVKSVGRKYVTVVDARMPNSPGDKFEIDGGHRADWYVYELFHSEDEYNTIKSLEDKRNTFKNLANGMSFTDEEIAVIMDMYNKRTGRTNG